MYTFPLLLLVVVVAVLVAVVVVLRDLVMHHHTKFHEERLPGSSDVRTKSEDIDPHCDLGLEDSNVKLPHNTRPASVDAPLTRPHWVAKG